MEPSDDPVGRRPLKVRSAGWARRLAAGLASSGVTPNFISGVSVFFALLASAFPGWFWPDTLPQWSAWVFFAACIQLRLICNLIDGMVAIEGGKKSVVGDLWNEIPDRFSDALFLLTAGWVAGSMPWAVAATVGALMTAYLRAFGHGLTGQQDFSGPGAKPQRMAVLTGGFLLAALSNAWLDSRMVIQFTLVIVTVLTWITVARRTLRLAADLKRRSSS